MKLNSRTELLTIKNVPVPKNSLANDSLSCIHYSDAYKALLPDGASLDIEAITKVFLTSVPSWVARLMKVRDRIVGLVGLKTSSSSSVICTKLEIGSRIGIFRVLNRSSHEILLGEDDRHLNFRVSISIEKENGLHNVTVSTVVFFHNWLGRMYFFIVGKIHKVIVSAMLKNMLRNL
ncbi:DUF2867 domain-containing protein [Paenibacillus anseongense]|uniref:DUF2867 domain-containing protein n=1 Tax=Paenibacillus anseongense TaxID=2682845 RepID=UPI002DB9B759|nr:DUF2867 domain-containing protein [Paenibacillus anseongense]MEC0270171.1 DUF2867 domain-containing protein [Paenibacillus anseongense]